MANNNKYEQLKEQYMENLVQFVPIVARVHGPHHPEFYDVQKIFNTIVEDKVDLKESFNKLREITDNYTIPDDVCETYEYVYQALQQFDESYQV
jgi:iron-sulfur cluster repair protein YtfE (RIC family)